MNKMKAGIKFLTLLLALSALFSCKPEYTIVESQLPTLSDGQVLWLDLTRFTHTNTSDPVALRQHWDALHLTTTLQGLVNRTAPQLNVFFLSMPVKSALGIAMLVVYIPFILDMLMYTKEAEITNPVKLLLLGG